jgi:4-amino-4-deoxy-L-arabinose transferase-like glycosyltransferase
VPTHRIRQSLIGKQPSLYIVLTAWVAFVSLGMACAFLTPLGEGFDEPWHLAYVQHVAQTWGVPMGHSERVSEEIAQFVQNHPVSWGLHSYSPSLTSYDEYWREDSLIRAQRDQLIQNLRFSGRYVETTRDVREQYERHQPPLYYLVSAPIFAMAARSVSFADTFLAVRLSSVLLASLTVPGAFFLATGMFGDRPWVKSILLLTVVFPGIYPGVIRVANDALAVPIAAWMLACLVHFLRTERRGFLIGASVLLAAGLWTKAFFIPLLIATLLTLWILRYFRDSIIMLLIAGTGAAWYVYNLQSTGSVTGLPETVASGSSAASSIEALWKLDWRNIVHVVRFSHIWVGNWSFLNVRGWMYRVISWLFIAGVSGCCLSWRSGAQPRALLALVVNYVVFLGALLYYATQVFQDTGTSVAEGWYLTLLAPAEAVLFAAGIRSFFPRRWPAAVAVFGFFLLALNVYANFFVMFPYYTGITAHAESGHLETYPPAINDLSIIPERLLRFHQWLPPFVPMLLIAAFVATSLWLTFTLFFSRGGNRSQPA